MTLMQTCNPSFFRCLGRSSTTGRQRKATPMGIMSMFRHLLRQIERQRQRRQPAADDVRFVCGEPAGSRCLHRPVRGALSLSRQSEPDPLELDARRLTARDLSVCTRLNLRYSDHGVSAIESLHAKSKALVLFRDRCDGVRRISVGRSTLLPLELRPIALPDWKQPASLIVMSDQGSTCTVIVVEVEAKLRVFGLAHRVSDGKRKQAYDWAVGRGCVALECRPVAGGVVRFGRLVTP